MTDEERIRFVRWLHRPLTDEERALLQQDTVARIKEAHGETTDQRKDFYRRRGTLGVQRRRALRPTSLSRVAARYAHLWQVTVREAAAELGLGESTVYDAWREIYPAEIPPRRRTK
jgi:hypothetical protein